MMNLAKLFFLLLLPGAAFAQEPEPKWETWLGRYEKGIGQTKVDMALKATAPDASVPYVLITGVSILDCKKGFPVPNEKNMLELVTDAVERQMKMLVKTIPAGTFTYNCERTDYYYISDTTYVKYLLGELYKNNFPQYRYKIEIRSDEQWQEYLQNLYLTDEKRKTASSLKLP